MSILPVIHHDEAWHRTKLLGNLARNPATFVQRFEDGYSIGICDMFVGKGTLGLWVECKHHIPAPNGALLPRSKVTGGQLGFLQRANGKPNESMILLFTEDAYVCCPFAWVSFALFHNKDTSILTPGAPKTVEDLVNSANKVATWIAKQAPK